MWNIMFLVLCLIFAGMLWIVFKTKETIKSEENSLFAKINLMTILGIMIEIALQVLTKTIGPDKPITVIFQRIYLAGVSAWFTAFSIYTFYILNPKYKKNKKKYNLVKIIHNIIFVILFILYMVMDIKYHINGEEMYTYGPAVDLLKVTIGGYSFVWIILSIINYKYIIKKSAIPILGIFLLIIANLVLQSINPTLLIVSLTITVVCYLMYFTIENPDLKMVNELYKNKNIMEQTYIDKSNFLFEMTQEVRNPIFNIKKVCEDAKEYNRLKDYATAIDKVEAYCKELDYLVNNVLNVNSLDANQIKFIDNKYDFNLLISEILKQVNEAINKNVSFNVEIENNIPILYGDGIKIKQILSSLLLESARHTKEGFIDFKVETIKRFDALRLIIQINDSSKGMPIEVINDILNTTVSLDAKDIKNIEDNEINMELCQKIIKLMGGNLLIKSTKEEGNQIILTIDQKFENETSKVNLYEDFIDKSTKVAIVSQDKKQNDYLKKFFNTNDIKTTIYLNGLNLIDDIKEGKKYNYIIVANDMKSINGYTIRQKLVEIEGFNTPMMIITNKESLKKHLLNDGFDEVIVKDTLADDLIKIIEKY